MKKAPASPASTKFIPPADSDLPVIRKLEREIAYDAARSDIECHCEGNGMFPEWYDITKIEELSEELVVKSIQYLKLRNLLNHHPANPDLVRIFDDPES